MTLTTDRHTPTDAARRIAETLELLRQAAPLQRRIVHAGDVLYRAGERFTSLHVLNSGFFKVVNLASDGREQVVGLHFKGDWLGFDGIAGGRYGCDAVAIDTGEVWSVRYDDLLAGLRQAAGIVVGAACGDESRDRARPRFDARVVHAADQCARRRLPALLGRFARRAWAAHRPDHAAADARGDRQLPRHDARIGEPRAVEAGARERDQLQREVPARHPDSRTSAR